MIKKKTNVKPQGILIWSSWSTFNAYNAKVLARAKIVPFSGLLNCCIFNMVVKVASLIIILMICINTLVWMLYYEIFLFTNLHIFKYLILFFFQFARLILLVWQIFVIVITTIYCRGLRSPRTYLNSTVFSILSLVFIILSLCLSLFNVVCITNL